MKISVIGLGYIGLPTACMFASNGIEVIGVDVNSKVVDSINNKTLSLNEPNLNDLLKKSINSGYLRAYNSPKEADVYMICVPTPVDENKKSDLKYVISATNSILHFLKKGDTVIIESTCPPKTTTNIVVPILEKTKLNIKEDIFVAYCPEKVMPGDIINEIVNNTRLIGGINQKSSIKAKEIYEIFCRGKINITDSTTAEMIKIAENTFRDINIAYANELCKMCSDLKINVWEVINFANDHPRVNIHNPGIGVGGHCIPVDPYFIIDEFKDIAKITKISREINNSMPDYTKDIITNEIKNIDNPTVTLLGLTYKENSNDFRESPAIELMKLLEETQNINLKVYDCNIDNFKNNSKTLKDALQDTDCIVLAVKHSEFLNINPQEIKNLCRNKIIIDTANALDKKKWEECGFRYVLFGCGR